MVVSRCGSPHPVGSIVVLAPGKKQHVVRILPPTQALTRQCRRQDERKRAKGQPSVKRHGRHGGQTRSYQ